MVVPVGVRVINRCCMMLLDYTIKRGGPISRVLVFVPRRGGIRVEWQRLGGDYDCWLWIGHVWGFFCPWCLVGPWRAPGIIHCGSTEGATFIVSQVCDLLLSGLIPLASGCYLEGWIEGWRLARLFCRGELEPTDGSRRN